MPSFDRKTWVETISETTTCANGTSATTAYAYGLERIAAYSENGVTRYVYDGRGSVAQAVNVPVAGEAVSSNLPDISVQVQSFSYTAYGEQMGGVKVSGFTYNAEAYDAATGMLNLRARQYEPALNRFSQKDIYPANLLIPQSFNAYLFTYNSPVSFADGDGLTAKSLGSVLSSIGSKVQKVVSGIGNTVKTVATAIFGETVVNTVVSGVKSVARTIRKAAQPIVDTVSTAWNKATQMYREAQEEISRLDKTAPDYHLQVDAIYRSACARYMGVEEETSAAKRDEKEQQIYELEQKLSDADRAAGIRVVELDGQLYYDYTDAIDRRMKNAISEFQSHMVGDRSNESVYDVLSHVDDYLWFMEQVNHNAPWDIKRPEPWKQQFGNVTMPKYNEDGITETVLYRGQEVTREDLGNITYGYFGSAMGISPQMLYLMGGVAKQINLKTASTDEIITALGKAMSDDKYFADDINDHYAIEMGIAFFEDDNNEEVP